MPFPEKIGVQGKLDLPAVAIGQHNTAEGLVMQRVLVLGCAGSGKTHLSRQIGSACRLPVVHLDRHYWGADWGEPDKADWRRRVKALAEAPQWVMDGNYGGTLPERLASADTVILLDLPTWLCLIRVLRRTLTFFGRTRGEDMALGCAERFDWEFIKYVIRYKRRHRPIVLKALGDYSGEIIVLKNAKSVERFAANLSGPTAMCCAVANEGR